MIFASALHSSAHWPATVHSMQQQATACRQMCTTAALSPAAYQCKAAAFRGANAAVCAGAAAAAALPATPALQCCGPTAQHCPAARRTAPMKRRHLPCFSEHLLKSHAAAATRLQCIVSAGQRCASFAASAIGCCYTSTRSVPPFCREPAMAGDTPTSRAPATKAACDQPCSLCRTVWSGF